MITCRSDMIRLPLILALCLTLTACVGLGGGSGAGQIAVTADAVVIQGPRGFCVDPEASRDGGASAFVLMGNCAAIEQRRMARQPQSPAVLTAAVSEAGEPGGIANAIDGLPAFFQGADGRAVLSRSGDADTVELLGISADAGVLTLHASDTSPGTVPGMRDDYWRAYFDIGPRIVTLSVLALADGDMNDATARALLAEFVALVRAANPDPGAAPDAAPPPPPATGLFNSGLFRGILGGRG